MPENLGTGDRVVHQRGVETSLQTAVDNGDRAAIARLVVYGGLSEAEQIAAREQPAVSVDVQVVE